MLLRPGNAFQPSERRQQKNLSPYHSSNNYLFVYREQHFLAEFGWIRPRGQVGEALKLQGRGAFVGGLATAYGFKEISEYLAFPRTSHWKHPFFFLDAFGEEQISRLLEGELGLSAFCTTATAIRDQQNRLCCRLSKRQHENQ